MLKPDTQRLLINVLSFQAGWWLCILYGDAIAPWVALGIILIHHQLVGDVFREWTLMVGLVIAGLAFDTGLSFLGVLVFPGQSALPPIWLVTLWLLFAMTLPHALRALVRHSLGFTLLCAVAGPLSYYAGSQFAEVKLGETMLRSLGLLSVCWGILGFIISLTLKRMRLYE